MLRVLRGASTSTQPRGQRVELRLRPRPATLQRLGRHRERLDDDVCTVPARVIEVAKAAGLREHARLLAAELGRPQLQGHALEADLLDPRDEPLEHVEFVVVVAEREGAVDPHATLVQRRDEAGVGGRELAGATERVELDDQLGVELARQATGEQRRGGELAPVQARRLRAGGDLPRIELPSHAGSTRERGPAIPGRCYTAAMLRLTSLWTACGFACLASLACAADEGGDSGDELGATLGEGTSSAGTSSESGGESSDGSTGSESETGSSESSGSEGEGTSSESSGSEGEGTSSESSSSDTSSSTSESTSTSETGDECLMCTVTLDSTQSSSFEALPGTEFMGYATLQGNQIIYALDEVGSGRVIYTADTNILYFEQTDCPLWQWLGQTGQDLPNVLSFGRYLCDGLGNNLGSYPTLTYAGNNLPQQYVGNPGLLAQDYDAVIYCTLAGTSAAEAQTIVDYVTDFGGGLYLASEYWGFINQNDLNTVNSIANPLGVQFEATNLDWGQANGDIDFACFPDPQ